MAKLIVLSIVIFTVIAPVMACGGSSPRRSLRTVQVLTFVAALLWAIACRSWYPQLVPID